MDRPHFLRVVQALSLVSGFTGAGLLGCSSSNGGTPPSSPSDAGGGACVSAIALPVDSGADSCASAITTGTLPACTLDDAGKCDVDATVGGGGISIPPEGGADVQAVVGGPLPPPELPA